MVSQIQQQNKLISQIQNRKKIDATVNQPSTLKTNQVTVSVETHNAFEYLSDEEDVFENTDIDFPKLPSINSHPQLQQPKQNQPPLQIHKQQKSKDNQVHDSVHVKPICNKKNVPPLKIRDIVSKTLTNLVSKEGILSDKFAISHQKGGYKVLQLTAAEDRLKVINSLRSENRPFFTYTPKTEKPYCLILKGIDHSYDVEDVTVALHNLHINVNVISITKMIVQRRYSSMWIVSVTPDSDIKSFLNIKFLLHHSVEINHRIKTGITQRHSCQRYGLSSSNCNLPPRCVKCTAPHRTADCTVTRQQQTIVDQN